MVATTPLTVQSLATRRFSPDLAILRSATPAYPADPAADLPQFL